MSPFISSWKKYDVPFYFLYFLPDTFSWFFLVNKASNPLIKASIPRLFFACYNNKPIRSLISRNHNRWISK